MVKAEYVFVYGDVLRRKSALVSFLAYPYMLSAFILIVGYGVGGLNAFTEKTGVDPVLFYVSGSYIMLSVMAVSDDLMWRPDFDHWMGTLPYVLLSPVSRAYRYIAIPLPRLTLVVLLGATSVMPVFTVLEGLGGILAGLIVVLIGVLASLSFIPVSMLVMGLLYRSTGENWRVLNIVRPLLMILIGVYYPRQMMPWIGRLVTYLLPPSNSVEAAQRFLATLQLDTYSWLLIGLTVALSIVYLPVGIKGLVAWEGRLRLTGVRTE
ncbi:ABC transporter permease [Desulfurococcus mucosus]|uniref:ABC transporter permease n=1 Tax=Desulfurococcus mucosus TaxID=2275 RepID=UPI00200F5881|nr:ABC transporter permease [Desulfurococcus mucosus]